MTTTLELEVGRTVIEIEGASSTIKLGYPGQDGLKGVDGLDGSDGLDGNDGLDGRGIAAVALDPATGELQMTMTDGSVFTSGDLRGKSGASLTVLTFPAADAAGYNAAVLAHATDPLTLVIRYAD